MSGRDGGPAFPVLIDQSTITKLSHLGLSLRDYFAAQALNGFFASVGWMNGMDQQAVKAKVNMADAMAELAYQYADAMLKARQS